MKIKIYKTSQFLLSMMKKGQKNNKQIILQKDTILKK